MFDTQNNLHDRGIVDVLSILSANGESGRLEMQAGSTEGFFFIKNGRLVDARVGDLTGFQAMNAVAAMRGARFTFDPSAVPPSVSSITSNERVVLKQFFGIDTYDANDVQEQPAYSKDDEATIETSRIPLPVEPLPTPVPEISSSRSLFYRGALVLAVLFILIAAGAVALRNKYRERVLTAAEATAEQPPAPAAEVTTEQPPAPAVASENKTEKPATSAAEASVAQDLTGKWTVVNTVQKTSYRSFQNLKIGFDLSISQNGKSFTGNGQKVSENGRSLPANSRTPIHVKGLINGDRVEATFFEDGTLRKTNGRFIWHIDKAGVLNGTFVSTAAGASGKSAAKKEL